MSRCVQCTCQQVACDNKRPCNNCSIAKLPCDDVPDYLQHPGKGDDRYIKKINTETGEQIVPARYCRKISQKQSPISDNQPQSALPIVPAIPPPPSPAQDIPPRQQPGDIFAGSPNELQRYPSHPWSQNGLNSSTPSSGNSAEDGSITASDEQAGLWDMEIERQDTIDPSRLEASPFQPAYEFPSSTTGNSTGTSTSIQSSGPSSPLWDFGQNPTPVPPFPYQPPHSPINSSNSSIFSIPGNGSGNLPSSSSNNSPIHPSPIQPILSPRIQELRSSQTQQNHPQSQTNFRISTNLQRSSSRSTRYSPGHSPGLSRTNSRTPSINSNLPQNQQNHPHHPNHPPTNQHHSQHPQSPTQINPGFRLPTSNNDQLLNHIDQLTSNPPSADLPPQSQDLLNVSSMELDHSHFSLDGPNGTTRNGLSVSTSNRSASNPAQSTDHSNRPGTPFPGTPSSTSFPGTSSTTSPTQSPSTRQTHPPSPPPTTRLPYPSIPRRRTQSDFYPFLRKITIEEILHLSVADFFARNIYERRQIVNELDQSIIASTKMRDKLRKELTEMTSGANTSDTDTIQRLTAQIDDLNNLLTRLHRQTRCLNH